jgi:hypothetical protein
MDLGHPDKVTPPPSKNTSPSVAVAPTIPSVQVAPPVAMVPEYNPDVSCLNLRQGIFPTAEAARNARIHCGDE